MPTLTSILPSSIKVPGIFLRVTLGVGFQSPLSGGKKVLCFGNKTSAGSAAVEAPLQVTSEDQARDLFGAGSELFWMCKHALEAYKGIQLYAIAVAVSAGDTAERALAFTSGPATATGTVTIKVYGETVVVPIDIGDTITEVAAAVAAAINAKTDWPVTASSSTGTCTVAAKHAGPRGNELFVEAYMVGGTGISFTDVTAYLAGGTTSDDPTNALDASAAVRYHYLVAPYSDATNLALFDTHITDQAGETERKRARFICGSIASLAASTTVSDGVNNARGQMVWHYNARQPVSVLAAVAAAELAEQYEANPAANCDGLRMRGILPQLSEADYPEFTELASALNSGLSPLQPNGNEVDLVMSTTMYHLDDGSNPDYRVIDVHKVEVADYEADKLEQNWAARFGGFRYDATPSTDNEVPDPGVATDATIKDWVYTQLAADDGRFLQNVPDLKDALVIEADEGSPGRANGSIPIDVIELLHQAAFEIRQVG